MIPDRHSGTPAALCPRRHLAEQVGRGRVAAERGIDAAHITGELLYRAIDRLWVDEDREGLRTKAHAVVSAYVDALFDGIGDAATRAA